jgi:hypothetical protein
VLIFTLVAPIAVIADDEVIAAEEQVLTAAPAPPSWDELSGYGSVESSRGEVSALWSGEVIIDQEQTLAYAAAAAATLWDATSGYGSVEASRAANALPAASTSQVSPDVRWAPTRSLGLAPSWDETSGSGPMETSRAAIASDPGSALAAGTRAESAHLATIPLPGEAG